MVVGTRLDELAFLRLSEKAGDVAGTKSKDGTIAALAQLSLVGHSDSHPLTTACTVICAADSLIDRR
jgi:hypothetical protein